jgi:hypothetical protein
MVCEGFERGISGISYWAELNIQIGTLTGARISPEA